MVLSALLFVHKESGSAEGKNFLWRLSPSLSPSPSLPFSVSLPSHLPRSSLAHTQSHTLARTLARTRTRVSFQTASTSWLFFPRFSRAVLFLRVFCPFPRLPVYTRNQAVLYPSVMPSSNPSAGRPVGVGCFQASACCPPLLPFSSSVRLASLTTASPLPT